MYSVSHLSPYLFYFSFSQFLGVSSRGFALQFYFKIYSLKDISNFRYSNQKRITLTLRS
jgi:hypothetical protein